MKISTKLSFILSLIILWLPFAIAAPTVCPRGDGVQTGYSDWATLQNDINGFVGTTPGVFQICPGTNFHLDGHNNIDTSVRDNSLHILLDATLPPITIQCGMYGLVEDNCVIHRGRHHIWIDQVGSITFKGLQFEEADRGSVWAGTGQHNVYFEDCIWRDNSYNMRSTHQNANDCNTGCAAVLGGRHGAVSFTNCQFLNNVAYSGAVYGMNMHYTFDTCLFEGNQALWRKMGNQPTGSAITLQNGHSMLTLNSNCFIDNDSFGSATVSLDTSDPSTTTVVGRNTGGTPNMNLYEMETYFDSNLVSRPNLDNSYQYCHNAIYQYKAGRGSDDAMDTCLRGKADCCRAYYGALCPQQDTTRGGEFDLTGEEEAAPDDADAANHSTTNPIWMVIWSSGWAMFL